MSLDVSLRLIGRFDFFLLMNFFVLSLLRALTLGLIVLNIPVYYYYLFINSPIPEHRNLSFTTEYNSYQSTLILKESYLSAQDAVTVF